jgi:hypothetical protein
MTLKGGDSFSPLDPPVQIVFEATSHTLSPKRLDVTLESAVVPPGVRQKLQVFNYQQNAWEVVDIRTPSATDTSFTVVLAGNLARFVSPTDRKMKAFLVYEETAGMLSLTWIARIDLLRWTVR